MTETSDYKHIKVSQAREETVIKAGIAASEGPDPDRKQSPDAPLGNGARSKTPDANSGHNESLHDSENGVGESTAKAAGYSPTTLDDVEGYKMSKAQITVIALAVIALAAFAIWYVATH